LKNVDGGGNQGTSICLDNNNHPYISYRSSGLNFATNAIDNPVYDTVAPTPGTREDYSMNQGDSVELGASRSRDNVDSYKVLNYTWNITASSTDQVVIVLYGMTQAFKTNISGIYNVTVIVRDRSGYASSDSFLLTVFDTEKPTIEYTVNGTFSKECEYTIVEDTAVVLDASHSLDNIGIDNVTWKIWTSDPVLLYGKNITYLFNEPGKISVTLQVADAANNSEKTAFVIEVLPKKNPENGSTRISVLTILRIAIVLMAAISIFFIIIYSKKQGKKKEETDNEKEDTTDSKNDVK